MGQNINKFMQNNEYRVYVVFLQLDEKYRMFRKKKHEGNVILFYALLTSVLH